MRTEAKLKPAFAILALLIIFSGWAPPAEAANTRLCELLVSGAAKSNPAAVKAAIEAGDDVNAICTIDSSRLSGRTAFSQPDVLADTDLALYFVEHGVNPDVISYESHGSNIHRDNYQSNFSYAAIYAQPEVLKALLRKGPQLELQIQHSLQKMTTLGLAAVRRRFDSVTLLLDAGANPMGVAFDLHTGELKDTLLTRISHRSAVLHDGKIAQAILPSSVFVRWAWRSSSTRVIERFWPNLSFS